MRILGEILMKEIKKNVTKYSDYPYLVYARVSSAKDNQKDSISNQIDIARYWLEKNEFEWNDRSVLKDEDKSGTLFLERTAMQLILQKARRREIEMVVFKSIHRLARDLKDALEIKEVLLAHGVRVITIEEDYDSYKEGKNDMKFEMHSMFAAQYPKTLSVSISSSLAAKVRRGEHIGKIPFGYDRIDGKLIINDEEAEVVRLIFKLYNVDGLGFKNITHYLNDGLQKGSILKPKYANIWQVTTIQSMIKNHIYYGTYITNRHTTVKVDGRKKYIQNPKSQWKIYKDHHPAIISKADWDKANSKPVVNKRNKITPWNDLRGLMKCGKCGSNMVVLRSWRKKKDGTKVIWNYFKCSAYRRGGKNLCVNHVPLTYENIRAFIVERLSEISDDIEVNFKDYKKLTVEKAIKNNETLLVNLNNKLKNLLDLYLDEIIDRTDYISKKSELEVKINEIEDEQFLLQNQNNNDIEIKDIQNAFKEIKRSDKKLYHAFNVLIDTITIHPDGEIDIEYKFDK